MHEIKSAIEKLFADPNITNYQIFKATGVSQVSLNKFSKGTSNIDNMPLGNALKLYNYYLNLKEENKLSNDKRDQKFGRLLAIANVLSQKVFEEDKMSISQKHMARFSEKPALTFNKIHKELLEYAPKFKENELQLLDKFEEIIASMEESEFNNDPLKPSYLHSYYTEQDALTHE